MPNRRTYSDDQLREAIISSTSWSEVLVKIGKRAKGDRTWIMRSAERLGLDVAHLHRENRLTPCTLATPLPFQNPLDRGASRSGLSVAAKWFLERGYIVSIPLEPTVYDLIAESDEGLKRIQVKTTKTVMAGRYAVRLTRSVYDPAASRNARGHYRAAPYIRGSIDYFFVVTEIGQLYLIPLEEVQDLSQIVLDTKYRCFLVSAET